jgi:hypothetical protein
MLLETVPVIAAIAAKPALEDAYSTSANKAKPSIIGEKKQFLYHQ